MTAEPQPVLDTQLAEQFADARQPLVRLCAHLAGDWGVAEDLAQETLAIAWRLRHRLVDPGGTSAWLAAIARNLCRRWSDRQHRAARHEAVLRLAGEHAASPTPEQQELALLLERALALLPPSTRNALLLHELHGLPHAVVASQLQLSEAAVAVRLHRGRLALRRLLQTELRAEAVACGLLAPEAGVSWHETPLWCPECGQRRLRGYLDPERGAFAVQCPRCCDEPERFICRHGDSPALFGGLRSTRVAYSRAMRWGHRHFRTALAERERGTTCWWCGGPVDIQLRLPHDAADVAPSQRGGRGVYVRCPHCHERASSVPRALLLHLPAGQRFWRANPRIRLLPERPLEFAGQPAILSGFERVDGGARLEVVTHRDSYAVLAIDGVPPTRGGRDDEA